MNGGVSDPPPNGRGNGAAAKKFCFQNLRHRRLLVTDLFVGVLQ
jgi:hypothetical protein